MPGSQPKYSAAFDGTAVSQLLTLNNATVTAGQVVITSSISQGQAGISAQGLIVLGNSSIHGNLKLGADGYSEFNFSNVNETTPLVTVTGSVQVLNVPEATVNGGQISVGQKFQAIAYTGVPGTAFPDGVKTWEPTTDPNTYVKFTDSPLAKGVITATGVEPNLSLAIGLTEVTKPQGDNINGGQDASNFNASITNLSNIVVSGSSQTLVDSKGDLNKTTFVSAVNGLAQQEAKIQSPNTVIIYISSHGGIAPDGQTAVELGSGNSPTDFLYGPDIDSLIAGSSLYSANKLFIVDACRASGLWSSLVSLPNTALITSMANSDLPTNGSGLSVFGLAVDSALVALKDRDSIDLASLFSMIQQFYVNGVNTLIQAGDLPEPLMDFTGGSEPPSDISTQLFEASTSNFELNLTTVPEPSSLSMVCLGMAILGSFWLKARIVRARASWIPNIEFRRRGHICPIGVL